MMTQEQIIEMVTGFAKANPEAIRTLRHTANALFNQHKEEMTASELEAAKVAFCLGGVWSLMNILTTNKLGEL